MTLFDQVYGVLGEQTALLNRLTPDEYTRPCPALNNATIGQHTRHVAELFQELIRNYGQGIVNYDARDRNRLMETDPHFAAAVIEKIMVDIQMPDKSMKLNSGIGSFETNYFRELLYNLEHCIHHQALIRVALGGIAVSDSFGVAPSTLEYRRQCAQ
jgi:hypothetical protein